VRFKKLNLGSVVAVIGAAVVLVAGMDLATYAGTGDSLLLGKINKSGTTTTVNNLGRGPVLNLVGGKPYPPLRVNSKKKVANFNADLLDGRSIEQLQPATGRLSITSADLLTSATRYYKTTIPAGWYDFTIWGFVTSTTTTDGYTCLIGDLAKLTVNDYTGLYAADQGALDAGRRGVVSASSIHRVLPGATVVYACSASGTGPLVQRLPITFSYRKVSDPTTKVGTPFTPRAVVRHKLMAR